MRHEFRAEPAQRITGRELAKPQQVGGLFERRLASQIVDIDSPVGQLAFGADDVADRGVGRDDVLKAGLRHRHTSQV